MSPPYETLHALREKLAEEVMRWDVQEEARKALKRRVDGYPPYRIIPLGNPTKPLCPSCGWPDHLPWCTWGTAMPSPP